MQNRNGAKHKQENLKQAKLKSIHCFHLKMDTQLIVQLEPLCQLFTGIKGVAGLISLLLEKFSVLVEKEHFFAGEQIFSYNLIHPDREIKRKSVQVRLPSTLFRRLKMIHQDLNYFSIAQIVRKLVYKVWMWAQKFQDKLVSYLEEEEKAWRKERKKIEKKQMPLENQQLLIYKWLKPATWLSTGHKTEYNAYYNPTFYYLC